MDEDFNVVAGIFAKHPAALTPPKLSSIEYRCFDGSQLEIPLNTRTYISRLTRFSAGVTFIPHTNHELRSSRRGS